ncbi:MAG TPA: lysine--tRNA ligase, partial [Polyangiaceae bacterium]|nr:lysine--tRNA ligase [Polyangiaceae bacterium]
MRQRGQDPFTNDIEPERITPLGDVRARFASALGEQGTYDSEAVARQVQDSAWGQSVTVAGRVIASRSFGKVHFLRIRDWSGEIQLLCRKNVLGDAFARLEDIDVADHVTATGGVMVTKTGELSLEVNDLRLLTKAYRPLPDKWAGLSDVELRYRRRYVDLVSNEQARAVFRARSVIVRALRTYLDDRGFLEVETPTMNTLVGGATAKPFVTHHNALGLELFMRIAPELHLKRLVVGGFERVYEVARCYRNEGLSTRHNPEFTMVEFYMAYATYETLMDMTEDMLRHVDEALQRAMPQEHAQWKNSRPFTLDEPFHRKTMLELLRMRLGAEARALAEQTEATVAALMSAGLDDGALQDGPKLRGVVEKACDVGGLDKVVVKQLRGCESHGELVFVLYELIVEPELTRLFVKGDKSVPVFVTDHPVEVSPLARRQTGPNGNPDLVDRFELFVHGRELCNAFSELNDPEDQAQRFLDQVRKKERGAEETMDYDEDYIRALEHGLPPTAGFGMGV